MNMIVPQLISLEAKIMWGMKMEMTFANDKTKELWQGFGPKIKSINTRVDELRYSINLYPIDFHTGDLDPNKVFTKWAAVETTTSDLQQGLEVLTLPPGPYAVFKHKGPADAFPNLIKAIFEVWLPQSKFSLDNRPHFEVLKPNYMPNNPYAEEDVWVPIK